MYHGVAKLIRNKFVLLLSYINKYEFMFLIRLTKPIDFGRDNKITMLNFRIQFYWAHALGT